MKIRFQNWESWHDFEPGNSNLITKAESEHDKLTKAWLFVWDDHDHDGSHLKLEAVRWKVWNEGCASEIRISLFASFYRASKKNTKFSFFQEICHLFGKYFGKFPNIREIPEYSGNFRPRTRNGPESLETGPSPIVWPHASSNWSISCRHWWTQDASYSYLLWTPSKKH